MTPRDLIAEARALDFVHFQHGAWHTKQHEWRNAKWTVTVEIYPSHFVVEVCRARGRRGCTWVDTFSADSADAVAARLRMRGVLPSPTGAAA